MRPRSLALVCCLFAGGCERGMRDMYDQPRPHPDARAARYADDRDTRPAPNGSIARDSGVIAAASSGRAIAPAAAGDAMAELARGRSRYDIYCAPCHGSGGDGDGMVVRRGFPRPPTLHSDAMRALGDAEIERTIANGVGRMPAFGARVDADDRRAITAYLRALQLSFHAGVGDLTDAERARLAPEPR